MPELGPKGPKPGSYALRWTGGRLTPKGVREDLLPLYGRIYVDPYLAYLDRSDTLKDLDAKSPDCLGVGQRGVSGPAALPRAT